MCLTPYALLHRSVLRKHDVWSFDIDLEANPQRLGNDIIHQNEDVAFHVFVQLVHPEDCALDVRVVEFEELNDLNHGVLKDNFSKITRVLTESASVYICNATLLLRDSK